MMGDREYEAIRLEITNIDEDDKASEEDAEMFAEAVEHIGSDEDGEGAASVARFTAKWLPKQAEGMKANGGLDLAEVDLDDDDKMNNVGVCCGIVRFATGILNLATDEGVWHPVKGPRATGPKSVADQMLMSHAPLLLIALRDTLTVLTRVLTNGEKSPDVNLVDEMAEYMNCIATLHRNMDNARDNEAEASEIVEEVESLLDKLTEDVGIVPMNPFGTKNGEHTA
jgi:hypothetical protein